MSITERLEFIARPDSDMETFVAHPASGGPFPAVILFQHIAGLSETMRTVARSVAAAGYICVAPALYYRLGRLVIDPVDSREPVASIRSIALGSLTPVLVMGDIDAVFDLLDGDPNGRKGACGVVGFGGGAAYGFVAAATYPERIGAMASILGAGFIKDTADSPHHLIERIRAEMYFAYVENDTVLPASIVTSLRDLLKRARSPAQVVVHQGPAHGYIFSDRPVYDAAAAERDWRSIFAMFERMNKGVAAGA